MMTETRIVLVKPGDVLIFGNVGGIGDMSALSPIKELLGLKAVLVFEGDIDMASVPADGSGA